MPTYELISALTISNTSTSFFEFTNVPQTYSDLVIHAMVRNAGGNYGGMCIFVNNVTETAGRFISLTQAGTRNRTDLLDVWQVSMTQDTADRFTYGYAYFGGYTKTGQNRQFFASSARIPGANNFNAAQSVRIDNTSAITSIKIGYPTLDYINSSSVCSLYGISNA